MAFGGMMQMVLSVAFNFLLMMLFAPKPKDTISYGPRLDNLKVAVKNIQDSVLNTAYGTVKVSGTVFWASNIRETVHTTETEYEQGKGGSSYTHTDVTYTYDCDFAVAICEGPIIGIRKIWANKELIYDVDQRPQKVDWLKYRVYVGSEYQQPDYTMEAHIGYEKVTAHRGVAYIVFEQFQLDPFGRRLPQTLEVEVVAKGAKTGVCYKYPQIDHDFCDTGNYSQFDCALGFFNTAYANSIFLQDAQTLVFPITSPNYVAHAKLFIPTGEITRYPLDIPNTYTCGGCGNDGYSPGCRPWRGAWGGGSTYIAWLNLPKSQPNSENAVGYYLAPTPCLLILHEDDFGDLNYNEALWVVNLINNRVIGTIEYTNMKSIGSFTWCYSRGISQGRYWGHVYVDGNSHNWFGKVDVFSYDIGGSTDEYGYFKTNSPKCIGIDSDQMTLDSEPKYSQDLRYGLWRKEVHPMHFIGFPPLEWYENEECKIISFDETPVKKIHNVSYEITDVQITTNDRSSIFYEGYTHSIIDTMEHSTFCAVKIRITDNITTINCVTGLTSSTTQTVTEMWYPAMLGPFIGSFDDNPLPPTTGDLNCTLIQKMPIFVYYIDSSNYDATATLSAFDGNHTGYWLKFINGEELISLKWNNGGTTKYGLFRKPSFYEYSIQKFNDIEEYREWYTKEVEPWADPVQTYFSYLTYQQVYSSLTFREVKPLVYYNDELDTANDFQQYTSNGWSYDLDNPKTNDNKYPFKYISGTAISGTAYWERGQEKIHYSNNSTCVYTFNLRTNVTTQEICCSKVLNNVLPWSEDYYAVTGAPDSNTGVYYLQKQIQRQPALLGEIIEDISEKAGIDLSILDISDDCYNTEVLGYNISDDIKLYDALETLLIHYFVDAFESEWKLKFRLRKDYLNYPDNITIIDDDEHLGTKSLGEDYNSKYNIILREDTQLPESLSYSYISFENNFNIANVVAIRNVNYKLGIKHSIKAPIAMYTSQAYSNCFRILFDMWRATKEIEFRLPNNFSFLEPGDLVYLPINASKYTNEYIPIKIYEITAESSMFLEIKGVEEDARNLEGLILDGAHEEFISVLEPTTYTKAIYFENSPLYNKFTNIDYTAGNIFFSAYSQSPTWKGGSIFMSEDNGVTYSKSKNIGVLLAPIGKVSSYSSSSILNSYYSLDSLNSITFDNISNEEMFQSTDYDYTYKEGNLVALVTDDTVEFIQFKTISKSTSAGYDRYTISGLTRGLYNSYIRTPTANTNVIFVPNGTDTIDINTTLAGTSIYAKAVSYGQDINNAPTSIIGYKAKAMYPYNVKNFKAKLNVNDIILTWTIRERNKPTYLLNTPEVIDPREFKIEIYDENNTLIRTVENITTNSYTYTNALLTADGFNIVTSIIKFVIYKKATGLEYNHTISSTAYFMSTMIPGEFYDTVSQGHLEYLLTLDNFTSISKNTDYGTNLTFTYNNYNGKSRPNSNSGYNYLDSVKITNSEIISCTNAPTYGDYGQFTVCMWVKIQDIPASGNYFRLAAFNGTEYTLHFWSNSQNLVFNFPNSGFWVPTHRWLFVVGGVSWASGKPVTMYIKDEFGNSYAKSHYNTNTTQWFAPETGPTVNIGNAPSVGASALIQELSVFDRELYSLTNDWSIIDALYNYGVEKYKGKV